MMKLSFTPLDPNPEWIRSCQINRIFLIDALLHTTYFSLVKEWNFVYVTFRKWYFEKNIFNLKFQWNNYISCTAFNDEFIPQIIWFLTIGKNCFLSNNSVVHCDHILQISLIGGATINADLQSMTLSTVTPNCKLSQQITQGTNSKDHNK